MQRKGDQSHHDDHRCEDRDDVTVAPFEGLVGSVRRSWLVPRAAEPRSSVPWV